MSSLDNIRDFQDIHQPYTPRTGANLGYLMRHRADRIQDELKEKLTPYVEVGYDAQQIRVALSKSSDIRWRLIPTGQIESVISIILGEAQ